jgi:sulfonate transport system permease protein
MSSIQAIGKVKLALASHPEASSPPLSLPRRRGRTSIPFSWALGFALPTLLLLLWEAAGRFAWVGANLLPPPSAVWDALSALAATGELWAHVQATFLRIAVGFFVGAAAATVAGALTGYSVTAHRLLDPTLQALRNIPSLAWVPLFILWLGIFEASKVALIAFGVFFPVYLNLMAGIRGVDRKLVEVARVYNFSAFTLVRRVLLPATLPAYMVGLRSGLGLGWMFVIAAEFMGASEGLGFLLIDGQMTGRPQVIIGAIILFALFGKATDLVLAAASKRVLFWQDAFDPEAKGVVDADDRERH